MKEKELTQLIELFLQQQDPIVMQVFAIYNNNSTVSPLFLTRDETLHLSTLYSNQLSKLLDKNKNKMAASLGSIEQLYFKKDTFITEDHTLDNKGLPSINYLLIELKKENHKILLLKKVTHKQLIEGRQHSISSSFSNLIKQRNVLDLTPKIQAISIDNHTFIA
ncbi:hypothetical protein [Myroides sp. WP-1]|uniref:hypothetical protein n=1 Tax=Myroides sp. WP-1 TaxID=2759944 RepID=UPI0015FD92E2|nr:hypothetical protein [Myroides sp. WP-1]MBB1140807.1 hypothetical protein [Myroides sp. WP-1]